MGDSTLDDPLAESLQVLGWSKRDFAKRLHLHENTVYEWGDKPPGYAVIYLRLMVDLRRLSA